MPPRVNVFEGVSTEPKQDDIIARLLDVIAAVDGLELSVDNIDMDMDDVEALLAQIKEELVSLNSSTPENDLGLPLGGEITVTDSATLLLSANDSRSAFTLQNLGTVACRVGPSGVTSSTGFIELRYRDFFIWDNSSQVTKESIYAICPTGLTTTLLVAGHVNLDDPDNDIVFVNGDPLLVDGSDNLLVLGN